MVTNNKFSKTQSRLLIYGEKARYKVIDCNNLEAVEETTKFMGMPETYMKNFNTWQELATARQCYEYMLSAFPGIYPNATRPTDEAIDWFWQKQLVDEYMVKDIKEIVAKYDHLLPDSPDRYKSKQEE